MMMRSFISFCLFLIAGCNSLQNEPISSSGASSERNIAKPLWVSGTLSGPSTDAVIDGSLKVKPDKSRPAVGKPQGPLRVDYLLENWAEDDFRLIVEVGASVVIDIWQVDVVLEGDQSQRVKLSELAVSKPSPNPSEYLDRRYFQLGSLAGGTRLRVSVQGSLAGRAVSKTVAVRLTESRESPKVCAKADRDCVRLLPAQTVY